jgi:phage host-nuclease inhibitor protein Gam
MSLSGAKTNTASYHKEEMETTMSTGSAFIQDYMRTKRPAIGKLAEVETYATTTGSSQARTSAPSASLRTLSFSLQTASDLSPHS